MKITVIQPPYFAGETPDEFIADFLIDELNKSDADLVVLPECSNAGGLSDPEREIAALPRAQKKMLLAAQKSAKDKGRFVAVNVLEERNEKLQNSTYLYDKNGEIAFVYDKIHLPPSEVVLQAKMQSSCFYPFVQYYRNGGLAMSYTVARQHIRLAEFDLSEYI